MPAPAATPRKNYEVLVAFWHDGQLRQVGEVLALTDHQAKHLVLAGNVRAKTQA